MEIEMDIIVGHKWTHEFMQAADLFSDAKRLGEYKQMVVTGTKDIKLHELVENMRGGLEHAGLTVSFVGIRYIDGKINYKYPPYIRPGVNVISTGYNWSLFEKILKYLGYKVETDEMRKVTKAYFYKPKFTIT